MLIKIKVKPNSKEERIEKISDKEFVIFVKEAPQKGKANEKVVRLLSKELGISGKNIKIKNPTSRIKFVEV